jgi:hypothetical protein
MRRFTSRCLLVVCLGLALPVAARERSEHRDQPVIERVFQLIVSELRHLTLHSNGDGLIPPKP